MHTLICPSLHYEKSHNKCIPQEVGLAELWTLIVCSDNAKGIFQRAIHEGYFRRHQ